MKNALLRDRRLLPYALIAPALVILAVFYLYPIGYNAVLSVFSWDLRGPMKFVGFGNFAELFTDPDFGKVIQNTLVYMGMEVSLVMIFGLILALFLNRQGWLSEFLQGVSFAPNVIALVSVSLIFVWLMDDDIGLFNQILSAVGLEPVGWLSDPQVALFSLVLVSVWKSVGLNALIILSALQSIPRYLFEAADLDNASAWTRFRRITIPMISPTLFFLVLVNVIGSFQAFDTINVMTQGGPQSSTNTLIFSVYREGFEYYRVGYAAAIAVVLMVLVGLITVLYFRAFQKRVHYR
ncbi:carbohydrate ABC transporter membrane protein 1 (CUT1 family) [Salinibacterium amurskyense]|uniref:Carbohydrate ABC transporter membrane protein 1 (CUT1 family) n=1 Tax=Salinibacterium amurskyense TaxID=205941 RepID=A0A2M9D7Q9_9MICO|nr:sugar ABC transporter permease [Salinibacterium amurskyense]PJJ81745.1 carbohydrate ABC transporter membrane protein 1 (CUT1 family) [Salinibacterium amurskyense]RLQ83720.1 sugar ABC transporter permease [Salinibacterium amurskyense]GHD79418.1 ABC transporter permease [Salinibacterium amurskyense]